MIFFGICKIDDIFSEDEAINDREKGLIAF